MTDDIFAHVAAARLLDRAVAIYGNPEIPPSGKVEAVGQAVNDLIDPLTACRKLLGSLMEETSDGAIQARADARAAEAKKRADLQRAREQVPPPATSLVAARS
jgi:hypothetical protein